jgi:predicted nucleic acid-binding Zn finger protein
LTCTCTCPDFVYRNKADTHSTCKHLRAVMAGLYRLACERGGVAEDGYVWLPGE